MAHTMHGHWIPGSEKTLADDRNIRLAKNCGGLNFCSDCQGEAEFWRKENLDNKAEVEEAKMRHPSKYPQSPYEWFNSEGYPVTAWRIREVLSYHAEHKKFPPVFEQFADSLEIDGTGKVLREVRPGSEYFQILHDGDFLVRHGAILHVIPYRVFLDNYSREPQPAQPAVNHPAHYGGGDNPYEAIKVIRAWDLGFELGNTVKYIARAGKKDPEKLIEDLEKAAWYLQDFINWKKEQS